MEIGQGEPKEKDIVWAKIKGYPWWPGTIRHIFYCQSQNNYKGIYKRKKYIIDFIGNKSHGEVNKNDIKLFKPNYEEHCKSKNPALIKSIELATKLYQEKNNDKNLEIEENKEDKDTDKDIFESEKKLSIKKDNSKNENGEKGYNLLNKKRRDTNDTKEEEKKEEQKTRRNNDIKINININVTNNNQRTVNINSFQNLNKVKKGKKKKRNDNKKKDDEEYILENEEEDESDENENEDIEESFFDKESLQNELMDIKINNNKSFNKNEKLKNYNFKKINININKKKKLIKGILKEEKDKKSENNLAGDQFYETFDQNQEKILKNEELNRIIHNLVNYQIQLSNTQNHKLILIELSNLQIAMKDDKNIDLNIYYNELYKLLSTFTYNKNSEIVSKSTEILTNLTHKIIENIFLLSEEDIDNLLNEKDINIKDSELKINNIENDYDEEESKKICDLILNLDNISEEISIKSKRSRTKKIINTNININDNQKYSEEKEKEIKENNKEKEFFSSNNNIKNNNLNFLDNIINIISNDLSDIFYQISENFFKNIYNRNDNGLEKHLANKRKHVCIRLFSLFKKVFPKYEDDYIKKLILFIEHNIRTKDPTFGEKYEKEIDNLFYKVKNINNEKNKDIN